MRASRSFLTLRGHEFRPWPGNGKMLFCSCSFRKRGPGLLCVQGISRAHIMELMFDLLFIVRDNIYVLPVLFSRSVDSVDMNFVPGSSCLECSALQIAPQHLHRPPRLPVALPALRHKNRTTFTSVQHTSHDEHGAVPVSYTHLTLPTIYSV